MDGTFASGDKTMEETSNPLSVHQDGDEAAVEQLQDVRRRIRGE